VAGSRLEGSEQIERRQVVSPLACFRRSRGSRPVFKLD